LAGVSGGPAAGPGGWLPAVDGYFYQLLTRIPGNTNIIIFLIYQFLNYSLYFFYSKIKKTVLFPAKMKFFSKKE